MSRPLTIRKPRAHQLRALHRMLEEPLQPWQRRRAEAILLFAAGQDAQAIARLLGSHANTIYADLHAFAQKGVTILHQRCPIGAPARITATQVLAIGRLAETPPTAVGLPYGRWSLAKLRAYLLKQRIVRAISREYLRRLLEKRGSTSAGCAANSPAAIPDAGPSCDGCVSCGGTDRGAASCCSLTCNR